MKILLDFTALALIYFSFFYPHWKSQNRDILFTRTLMYIYLTFVLYFTLMPILTSLPFIFNHPYTPMNLIPFIDVTAGHGDFIRQIVLNIVMTIPFGFLLPLTKHPAPSFLTTLLYTFILSFCIETLQPLINGFCSSDITDIITNVLGGCIGYLLYLLLRPLLTKLLTCLQKPSKLSKP